MSAEVKEEQPVINRMGWAANLYSNWRGRKRGARRWLFWLSMVALALQSGLLFLALFEPGLPYTVSKSPAERLDSREFLHVLSALTGAPVRHWQRIEVLTNGERYYQAELDAIRQARYSVNLEAYIFEAPGEITRRFIDALTERARAGVKVNLLVDAIGSSSIKQSHVKALTDAGGRVAWYHPLTWHTWPRMNNRTHRELIIVDGRIGFIGGSGFADHWYLSEMDSPRWRDTMVRVEGEIVTGLQGAFAENWLEAAGEVLTGREYFPIMEAVGSDRALVVASSPGAGRSTDARVLFQVLLASAQHTIDITTPYFLPDSAIRDELVRAIKERGVDVKIVVPGQRIDHQLTRNSSRRLFGELLQAGAKIYEYQPSMIHAKTMVIDGLWSVVGSTNMDSRSFNLNDEVNLAVADPQFAARLEQDFANDVRQSREITYEQWKNRPLLERGQEWFGGLIERQQ